MIDQHHINMLNNANRTLQIAWNAVLEAKQGSDPVSLQNSVMRYFQALQQVNVVVETIVNNKVR